MRRRLLTSVFATATVMAVALSGPYAPAAGRRGSARDPGLSGTELSGTGILPNFKARGRNLIRLRVGAFDPLTSKAPAPRGVPTVDAGSLPTDVPAYWLVQVRDHRYAEARNAIAASGARVAGVVPDDTYLVRATPRQRAQLRTDGAVRWSGYYQPAWRMATALGGKPGLVDLKGTQIYRVYAVRSDPDAASVGRALRSISGVKVLEDARVVVDVAATAAQLPAIASIPAVEWVGAKPVFVPLNANARWVTDTGVRDLYAATRFDRLTGAGQTAAVADTATNYTTDRGPGHIAFRDCAGADAGNCKLADYTQRTGGIADEAYFDIVANHTNHRKMAAFFDLGNTGPNPSDDSSHGTHTAGSVAGDAGVFGVPDGDDGMAPGARLVDQNIADATGGLAGVPGDYYQLFRQAYRPRDPAGVPEDSPEEGNVADYANYISTEDARTHNNSYGIGVPIADPFAQSIIADQFVWDHEDMNIVVSAGNGGPGAGTNAAPGVLKNGWESAASSNGRQPMASIGNLANFSSHGPTGDGRFGPTVATPGEIVVSPKGGTADMYHYLQGTSMSAPVLTGLLTLVRQYFYDGYGPAGGKGFGVGAPAPSRRWNPSTALVKAAVVNGAVRMRGWYTGEEGTRRELDGQWPSGGQGFGLVNLDNALYFRSDPTYNWYHDVWRADEEAFDVSNTAASRTYEITVTDGAPLDVTLAWTDAPDTLPAGTPALVNNLDLVVTGPDGVLLGNSFNSMTQPSVDVAETVLGGGAPDTVNNIERIRVAQPTPGTYTIEVRGTKIMTGRQGFALSASGIISAPNIAMPLGRPRQADAAGSPTISAATITAGSSDVATVQFTTSEPTTATATLTVDGTPVTYIDSYNLGGDVSEPATFHGFDTSPVETGPDFANKPMVGTRHEIFVTGLSPGAVYQVTLTAIDLADNKATATLPYTSPANVFQPQAADIGQLGDIGGTFTWKNGKQMYAGEDDPTIEGGALGAFMFRIPASFDPESITGAVVELTAGHDLVNHYNVDPLFSVDLLPNSLKAEWGTQDYATIAEAKAVARAQPGITRLGTAGQRLDFTFSCSDLKALKGSLASVTDGKRLAPFRWDGTHTAEVAVASVEFGFNRRSRGPDLRPRLILLTASQTTVPPLSPCDPAAPAPRISDVRIDNSHIEGNAEDGNTNTFTREQITVSWRTDVPSDSIVLFRPKGGTTFTQVGTPARTTLHQVGVLVDTSKHYEFVVRSTACNGASTTADNGGAGWDLFRAVPPDVGPAKLLPTLTFDGGPEDWTTDTVDNNTVVVGDMEFGGIPPATNWELRAPGDGSELGWHAEPYGDKKMAHLTSPPIRIPSTIGAFRFREHHDFERPIPGVTTTGDALRAEYSIDGGTTWTVLEEYQEQNEGYPNYVERETRPFNVPAEVFQIRFTLNSDDNISSPPFQGAAVDTVTPLYFTPPLSPFDPFLVAIGPVVPKSAGASGLGAAAPPTLSAIGAADIASGTGVCAAGNLTQVLGARTGRVAPRPGLAATGVADSLALALMLLTGALALDRVLVRRRL